MRYVTLRSKLSLAQERKSDHPVCSVSGVTTIIVPCDLDDGCGPRGENAGRGAAAAAIMRATGNRALLSPALVCHRAATLTAPDPAVVFFS